MAILHTKTSKLLNWSLSITIKSVEQKQNKHLLE